MFSAFFDNHKSDGLIQKEDIVEILEKFRNYCGYEKTDEKFIEMTDIMLAFYECMLDQVRQETMKSTDAYGFDTVKWTNFRF